jgi:glycosyltransferase involved in cell wall biosynthesis
MRRVLVVAYMFPPVAGVGIERTLQHVIHLPQLGWQPVVVAPATPGYRLVDPRTLDRVPAGTEVHRAISLEPAHVRRWLGVLRGSERSLARRPQLIGPPAEAGGLRHSLNEAWRRYVELAWFPDEQLGWAPAAIAAGVGADADEPVDAIYSSGPPWTSHLVAAAIQGLTGLPWVADFRDPWVGNAYAVALPPPHRAARAWLERRVVDAARVSVFASAGVRDEYQRRYPALADRFVTIHNGYDLDDVAAVRQGPSPPGADGLFRLAFTGSLQGEAEARLLADGLELLVERRPDVRDRLRVQLVGWLSPRAEAEAGARLDRLTPVVERMGQVPKATALSIVQAADAGLILLADAPGRRHVPSAKLFDYLGLDRWVLAVAPDGEVRRILTELEWGAGVDPTPVALANGIERLLESSAPTRQADPDRRFERRTLSRRLADVLDAATGQAGVGTASAERRPTPR